jgi:peptide/nickel transport system permease protein
MKPIAANVGALEPVDPVSPSPGAQLRRRVFGQGSLVIGSSMLALIVFMAIFAPLIAPYDPYQTNLVQRLQPPFWHEGSNPQHPLGTDRVGRDYLSRLIYGARISLMIGIITVLISGLIGTLLGLMAGYFGGWVDAIVSYVVNTRLSIPLFLVAIAVVSLFGASLTITTMVLSLFLWDQFAVVTRSATQQVRRATYVKAAQAVGCSTLHILFREVLPNIRHPLMVVAIVEVANAILLEASLSFLGFGVQAPLPAWGLMLADAREFMFFDPWLLALPGSCLFVLLLAMNLVGDGLRDLSGGNR